MPSSTPSLRTVAIVAAAIVAVATPIVQALTGTLGVGGGDFAQDGQTTLEAAGYAFSIWTPIYAGLLAYGIYQALPTTPETPGLRRLGWPSVVAMLGCAAWLVAASLDVPWATVVIIVVSAAALCVPLRTRDVLQAGAGFWLIVAPLSLLAGWLTIAAAINILTVLTREGLIDPASAGAWATAGVLSVVGIALAFTWVSTNWVYPLPIAWGLVAVFVAERTDRPAVAMLSLVGAASVLAAAGWAGTGRRSQSSP